MTNSMVGSGLLVGVGTLPWFDNRIQQEIQRPKLALSSGPGLPDMYDVEDSAFQQAQRIPQHSEVVVRFGKNRFRQLVVQAVELK